MGFIYKITTPTGRLYVGQTKNLSKRIGTYKHKAKNYKGTILILKSISKYGWDAHKLEIIEEVKESILDEREIFWIDELRTYIYQYPEGNGINLKTGGASGGGQWKHDTNRVSRAMKAMKGSGNHFYQKKHSEETKGKIGQKAKKRNLESGQTVPKWGAEKGRTRVMRKVNCFNDKGDFVVTCESATEAGRKFGVDISLVVKICTGRYNNSNGFTFRYFTGENVSSVKPIVKRKTFVKRPVVMIKDNLEVVAEYISAKEAAKKNNLSIGTVKWATRLQKKLTSGHLFIYKDIYETQNLN